MAHMRLSSHSNMTNNQTTIPFKYTAPGDKIACWAGNDALTWAQLEDWSDRIAAHLWQCIQAEGNVSETDTVRIGVNMQRSLLLLPTIYAILKLGCSYVPLDADVPEDRRAYINNDANIRHTITDAEAFAVVSKAADDTDSRSTYGHFTQKEAYVIYTSGTTGRPKGVPITYRALTAMLDICADKDTMAIHHESIILLFVSINFDASIIDIFSTLYYGATLVVAQDNDRRSVMNIISLINSRHVTHALITPSFLNIMDDYTFTDLETLATGGESMPRSLAERVIGNYPYRFVNAYGPTENTVISSVRDMRSLDDLNNIGRPLRGVVAYVVDEQGNRVAKGEPGELILGGELLSEGYLNLPDVTAKAFFPNPFDDTRTIAPTLYHTGDIVREQPDGSFIFIGRRDNQVKIRGFRIELSEIVSCINQCKGVSQSYVKVEDICNAKQLVAYVVLDEAVTSVADIKHELIAKMPHYMIPAFWNILTEFPVTQNGKVDAKRLQNRSLDNIITNDGQLTSLETRMVTVIANILGLPSVNVNLDLIHELGITSIQTMNIIHDLEKAAIHINAADILNHGTIHEIAANMKVELTYWYNDGPETTKPVIIVLAGFNDFGYMYTKWADKLTDMFSLFVVESYHHFLADQWDVTCEGLNKIYEGLVADVVSNHHIAAIAGICIGGEHSLILANSLYGASTYKPLVVVMDGEIDRVTDPEKIAYIEFPFLSKEENRHRNHVDNALVASFPQFKYAGPLVSFVCDTFIDYWTVLDPDMTETKDYWMKYAFDTNADRWRRHYPEADVIMLPTHHCDFWLTEPSLSIMADYIKDWYSKQ